MLKSLFDIAWLIGGGSWVLYTSIRLYRTGRTSSVFAKERWLMLLNGFRRLIGRSTQDHLTARDIRMWALHGILAGLLAIAVSVFFIMRLWRG